MFPAFDRVIVTLELARTTPINPVALVRLGERMVLPRDRNYTETVLNELQALEPLAPAPAPKYHLIPVLVVVA